jgi:hypothetical protein
LTYNVITSSRAAEKREHTCSLTDLSAAQSTSEAVLRRRDGGAAREGATVADASELVPAAARAAIKIDTERSLLSTRSSSTLPAASPTDGESRYHPAHLSNGQLNPRL